MTVWSLIRPFRGPEHLTGSLEYFRPEGLVCFVSIILTIIVTVVQFEDEYVMALFCYILLYYA